MPYGTCVCCALEDLMKSTTNANTTTLTRLTPAYWRITVDHPPLNLMGPEFVLQFREIVTAIETDEQLKVVVVDSAVEGFFLNHSDFLAKLEDLTGIPAGPTGLPAWPGLFLRLTPPPAPSLPLLRRRATGNGTAIALPVHINFSNPQNA